MTLKYGIKKRKTDHRISIDTHRVNGEVTRKITMAR